MIWFAGLTTCMVTGFHLMGWVTINFAKIDEDLLHIYNRSKKQAKDKGLVAKAKRFFIRTVPLFASMSSGFWLGFKGEDDD